MLKSIINYTSFFCCLFSMFSITTQITPATEKIFLDKDFFERHINLFNRYKSLFHNVANVRILEIGSLEGRSTLWMAENFCTGNNSFIDSVDTWMGSMEHGGDRLKKNLYERFLHNTQDFREAGKIVINRGFSSDVLMKFVQEFRNKTREGYDFIFIDASHTAKDVLMDAILCWELLKNNGIIIFDDYEWDKWVYKDKPYLTPRPAIDGFLASYQTLYQELHRGYQIHIKKIAHSPTGKPFIF